MADITYEEMKKTYNEVSKTTVQPDLTFTNINTMRKIWGDEQVDEWIAEGRIQVLELGVAMIWRGYREKSPTQL